jgi:chromosome segregation ATPase
MVSLEQIRALEARVEKAVILIDKLRKENAELEQRLVEMSRTEEAARAIAAESERKAAAAARTAVEAVSRLDELGTKAKESEAKAQAADLRTAEAVEKAQALERKAQAVEAEVVMYRERALSAERRAAELENRAEDLRKDQTRIEEGLVHALEKLDAFEDLVMGISSADETDNTIKTAAEPRLEADVSGQEGDEKVEAVEKSLSTPVSQEDPFPGAENELDIF